MGTCDKAFVIFSSHWISERIFFLLCGVQKGWFHSFPWMWKTAAKKKIFFCFFLFVCMLYYYPSKDSLNWSCHWKLPLFLLGMLFYIIHIYTTCTFKRHLETVHRTLNTRNSFLLLSHRVFSKVCVCVFRLVWIEAQSRKKTTTSTIDATGCWYDGFVVITAAWVGCSRLRPIGRKSKLDKGLRWRLGAAP